MQTLLLSLILSLMNLPGSDSASTTFEITADHWEACETGQGPCEPLTFERTSLADHLTLSMPCAGTLTTVHLLSTENLTPLETISVSREFCPPTLDLAGREDGEYRLWMLGCGLGGMIKFSLQTK